MPDARNAFVVLGAHRSGTSAMARVLNLAGLGAMPADLVPPHPVDNPTGFWEARPIIELNDAILADNGCPRADAVCRRAIEAISSCRYERRAVARGPQASTCPTGGGRRRTRSGTEPIVQAQR